MGGGGGGGGGGGLWICRDTYHRHFVYFSFLGLAIIILITKNPLNKH